MELSHGEREHRGRNQFGINIYFYSVCGEHACRAFCENIRVDSRVVRYRDGRGIILCVEIIRQTLGRLVDGENIHSVCARAENSAQTARAEFERTVKSIRYLIFFAFNGGKFVMKFSIALGLFQPEVIEIFDFLFHCSAPFESRWHRLTHIIL